MKHLNSNKATADMVFFGAWGLEGHDLGVSKMWAMAQFAALQIENRQRMLINLTYTFALETFAQPNWLLNFIV